MDYLKKNPKLVQLGVVLIGFVVLILMTGQYSEIIDVRDGFTKAVEKGEIVAVAGFSESLSMILRGQLPPQFVRIPELNFYNPVVNASMVYILATFLIMAGLIFNNYYSKIHSSGISLGDWFRRNWSKLFLYALIAIFGGLFVAPSLVAWFFGEPGTSSFWDMPVIVTDFANYLMYHWFPVEIYDPEIDEFEDSALVFEITRAVSAALLFAIEFVREILLGGVKTIVSFSSWDWVSENEWARWPALPWTVVCAGGAILGYALQGRGLAMLVAFSTIYISVFGQWQPSMETLSLVLIAAPVSVVFGLLFGVWSFNSRTVESILNPLLNIAQTMPHFSYLVPVMVFFGIGDQAGAMLSSGFNIDSTVLLLNDQTPNNNPKTTETGAAINTNESVSIEGCHCPKTEI
jgi:glycine betaine/proline transport system permease protein